MLNLYSCQLVGKLIDAHLEPVPVGPEDSIERKDLLTKLSVSKTTLLRLEKEGWFTPTRRGRKTYYPRPQLRAYLLAHNYKSEAIDRITAPTPTKKP